MKDKEADTNRARSETLAFDCPDTGQPMPVYHLPSEDILRYLNTNPRTGLLSEQVLQHRERFGSNALPVEDSKPWYKILFSNLANPITFILLICFTITVVFQEWIDATSVMAIIVLNTSIGFISEMKSKGALDALRQMSKGEAKVIRDSALISVTIDEVVVGDILALAQGDCVAADGRLISDKVIIDEALLTGESEPQTKICEALPIGGHKEATGAKSKLLAGVTREELSSNGPIPAHEKLPIGERHNMVFRQTIVVEQSGLAVITATGFDTKIGQLSKSLQSSVDESSEFEKRVNRFLFAIFGISLILVFVIIAIDHFSFSGPILIYSSATSIALLPESILLVVTIICALAMRSLSQRNAIVRKLNVLSTLGTITVLCSDKTGTLTEGKMTAKRLWPFVQPNSKDRKQVVESPIIAIGGGSFDDTHRFYNVDGYKKRQILNQSQKAVDSEANSLLGDSDRFEDQDLIPYAQAQQQCYYLGMVSALCNQTLLQYDADAMIDVDVDVAKKSPPQLAEKVNKLKGTGNPTELALAVLSYKLGLENEQFEKDGWYKCGVWAFDSKVKCMSVAVRRNLTTPNQFGENFEAFSLTKGAPDVLLQKCSNIDQDRSNPSSSYNQIMDRTRGLASQGYRVLACAVKKFTSQDRFHDMHENQIELRLSATGIDLIPPSVHHDREFVLDNKEGCRLQDIDRSFVESELTFVGIVAIFDPPKQSAFDCIQICTNAHIQTIMLTGDAAETARNIATRLTILKSYHNVDDYVITGPVWDSLPDEEIDKLPVLPVVIARCSPHSKVKMVEALQRRKQKVAMTGDGSNDAISIQAADVGACMGSGAELTKQVSDIVIADDEISTLVKVGIAEGRHIQQAIKRFVVHLLTGNSSEVTVLLFGLLFSDAEGQVVFPLSPLQILSVNMITSSLIAIALAVDDIDPQIMTFKPETANFLTLEVLIDTLFYGLSVSALSFFSYILVIFGFGNNELNGFPVVTQCNHKGAYESCKLIWHARSTTYAVMTVVLLFHGYVCRHSRKSMFSLNWLSNKMMLGSVVGGTVLLVPFFYIPWLADNMFKHAPITWEWLIVLSCVLIHCTVSETYKFFKRLFLTRRHNKAKALEGSNGVEMTDLLNNSERHNLKHSDDAGGSESIDGIDPITEEDQPPKSPLHKGSGVKHNVLMRDCEDLEVA